MLDWEPMSASLPAVQPLLVAAARRQAVDRAPVWIMRQAGRYLPEYRKIRERVDFATLCRTPDLAAEVSKQPVDILGVDAAIIFSDILVPLEAMGLEVVFTDKGPKLPCPIRSEADVQALVIPDPADDLPFVGEAIRVLKRALEGRVPIIGFAGAPFTMAAYAIEGGGSKDYSKTKRMMIEAPEAFSLLLDKIADTVARSLTAQVEAGAELVQIFDSWGGMLGEAHWRQFALPATRKIVRHIQTKTQAPITLYLGGGPHLIDAMVDTGADVISLDWRVDLGKVFDRHGDKVAIQGNMDPTWLYAEPDRIREEVARIRRSVTGRPGHIWNLGHGILPDVPVDRARAFVEAARGC